MSNIPNDLFMIIRYTIFVNIDIMIDYCTFSDPPTSPERRACETAPPSLDRPEHPCLSNSQRSKQGQDEDIIPASPGSQTAEVEESYPHGTQAAEIMEPYHLTFF